MSDLRSSRLRRSKMGSMRRLKGERKLTKEEKDISYITNNHISVIFKLYGSVWPQVLPFCITNTVSCAIIWIVDKRYESLDLSIDPSGHRYMAALVSFLVIARLRIMYGYTIKAREQLSKVTRNAHDLVECAVALTAHDKSLEALEWRRRVALGSIEFLRDCMDALSYNSEVITKEHLTPQEKDLRKEYFRKPTLTGLVLKKNIISHRYEYGAELSSMIERPPSEQILLNFVDDCQDAFYSMNALINNQFPFPLVQMARTILIFWVYTLPFALQHTPYPLWGMCGIMFLLTYGFMGIESVCLEMSDPFGDDPTDFDQVNLARITFEDIYLTLYRNDGHEGEVSKVRQRADSLLDESPYFKT